MASQSVVVFHPATPAQFSAINQPKSFIASYEVRNMSGMSYLYLCNAVPNASYLHKGDGWTRVTVPVTAEAALLAHLQDFFEYAYRRVS